MRYKIILVATLLIVILLSGCPFNENNYKGLPEEHKYLLYSWEKGSYPSSKSDPVDPSGVQTTEEWSKFGSQSMRAVYDDTPYWKEWDNWEEIENWKIVKARRPSWYIYDCPQRLTNWSFATWLYYDQELNSYNIRIFHTEFVSVAGNGISIYIRTDDGSLIGGYEVHKSWNVVDQDVIEMAEIQNIVGEHYVGAHYNAIDDKISFILDDSSMSLYTDDVTYDGLEAYWNNFHVYTFYNIIEESTENRINLYYDDTYFAYESLLTVEDLINHYNANVSW